MQQHLRAPGAPARGWAAVTAASVQHPGTRVGTSRRDHGRLGPGSDPRSRRPCACSPPSTRWPRPPARSSAPPTGSTIDQERVEPVRRRHRRPPVDPRRRRAGRGRPVRRHHRPRLPHACRWCRASAARCSAGDPRRQAQLRRQQGAVPATRSGRQRGSAPRVASRGHRPPHRQAADAAATPSRSRARPSPPASPRPSYSCCPGVRLAGRVGFPDEVSGMPGRMTRVGRQPTRSMTSGVGVRGAADVVAALERRERALEAVRLVGEQREQRLRPR